MSCSQCEKMKAEIALMKCALESISRASANQGLWAAEHAEYILKCVAQSPAEPKCEHRNRTYRETVLTTCVACGHQQEENMKLQKPSEPQWSSEDEEERQNAEVEALREPQGECEHQNVISRWKDGTHIGVSCEDCREALPIPQEPKE